MITSATQATEIAVGYLKPYYEYSKPQSAKRVNGRWVVKVDVGLLMVKIATVEIDASTGEVISYDLG